MNPAPPPPTDSSTNPGTVSRLHDLDALRASAMLLGIGLHAALAFFPGIWPVRDDRPVEWLQVPVAAIHGFRMPLFFLISGFFTAMLWRRRGLGGLIRHRAKRILLPLILFTFTIIPLQIWITTVAGRPSPGTEKQPRPLAASGLWNASQKGDLTAVRQLLKDDPSLNAQHPHHGGTPLSTAAAYGHAGVVSLLLEAGSDVNARNRDGATALHGAAFFGHAVVAERLLAAGADPTLRNQRGESPTDSMTADWGLTKMIAGLIRLDVDKTAVFAGRKRIAKVLAERGLDVVDAPSPKGSPGRGLLMIFFLIPVFHHLWFLWFLCWLIVGFSLATLIVGRWNWNPRWNPWITGRRNFLWLVPVTLCPQTFMGRLAPTFGPDTSIGLLPLPHVLAYYAIFFGFGALYYAADDRAGRLGREWQFTLPVGLLVLFPLGLEFAVGGLGFRDRLGDTQWHRLIGDGLEVLYAWTMTFAAMGLFRVCVRAESRRWRYLSDASYWLYVAHLPLVFAIQGWMKHWQIPGELKFLLICLLSVAVLLVSYRYLVSPTWLGRLLNGPRQARDRS